MIQDRTSGDDQDCRSCRFWRRDPASDRGPDWGECRRMPPTLPPIEQEKLLHVGIWPHTSGDDWCGEWQPADRPPER
jgi:hypothetical protein